MDCNNDLHFVHPQAMAPGCAVHDQKAGSPLDQDGQRAPYRDQENFRHIIEYDNHGSAGTMNIDTYNIYIY